MKKKLAIFTAAVGFFTLCNVVLYTRKLRSDEMTRFWHWSVLPAGTGLNCSGSSSLTDEQASCGNISSSIVVANSTLTIDVNTTWHRQRHRDITPERSNGVVVDQIKLPEGAVGVEGVAGSEAASLSGQVPSTVSSRGTNASVSLHRLSPQGITFPSEGTNRSLLRDPPQQSSTVAGVVSVQSPVPLQPPSRAPHRQFVLDNRTFYIGDGVDAAIDLPVTLPALNNTVRVTFGISLLDDIVDKPKRPHSSTGRPLSSSPTTSSTTPSTLAAVNISAITYRLINGTSLPVSPTSAAAPLTSAPSGGLTILNQHPFKYLIDVQNLCGGGGAHQVMLLVLVTTSVSHFAHRQAIRDSWGSLARGAGSGVRLAFVMGRPADPALEPEVVREAIHHADIVQEDFLDTYKNLTLKTMMLLKWAHTHCPTARYVMKSDDDMFLNLPNLLKYLSNLSKNSRYTKGQLFGRLVKGARPLRSKSSKYFVPVSDYRGHVYPDYLSGTAYVMSSDVAPKLLATAQKTPIFFFEDVFITGICAKKAGIVRRNHVGFVYYKRPVKGCAYAKVISGHNNTPNDLRNIWKDLQKKNFKC